MILAAAAGGQDGAIGVARQEFANRCSALFRLGQIIQPEFEEFFAGVVFLVRVRRERFRIRKTERDTDAWKYGALGH